MQLLREAKEERKKFNDQLLALLAGVNLILFLSKLHIQLKLDCYVNNCFLWWCSQAFGLQNGQSDENNQDKESDKDNEKDKQA